MGNRQPEAVVRSLLRELEHPSCLESGRFFSADRDEGNVVQGVVIALAQFVQPDDDGIIDGEIINDE